MRLERTVTALARAYRHAGAALVIALVSVIFGNIVLRECFSVPIAWANELALVLFVWMVFVGAGVAFAEGARIRFTLLVDQLPVWARVWTEILVSYLGLLLLAGFLVMGLYMTWTFRNQRFVSMDATVAFEWIAAPTGTLLAVLGWLRHGMWRPRDRMPDHTPEPAL
jgi:TRAP-type C4-dicarboxylate transport system permease small subunit